MKILLTGAFGYLAGRLATWLREAGHTVVLSDRELPDDAKDWAAEYEVRLGDILDPQGLPALVRGVEAVVNLASLNEHQAVADPELALRISAEGNRLLLNTAKAADVSRFLFFSTFHVYGPGAPLHITEEIAVRAAHPYAISHFAGEGFCREANRTSGRTWALTFRLSNGYGCPVRRNVDRWTLAHNDFCRQAVETGRIVLNSAGTQERDFVWVEDVASAIDAVFKAPEKQLGEGVFNVGGQSVLSILNLVNRVAARSQVHLGKPVSVERPVGSADPGEPSGLNFDVSRLAALGYSPRDQIDQETDRLLELLAD